MFAPIPEEIHDTPFQISKLYMSQISPMMSILPLETHTELDRNIVSRAFIAASSTLTVLSCGAYFVDISQMTKHKRN